MEARRRWATSGVAIVAIAAGAVGGAYLWKEAFPSDSDPESRDRGLVGDASADARGSRGKSKSAKRKGSPGKARPRPKPTGGQSHGQAGAGSGGHGDHGGGGADVSDDAQDDEGSTDEGTEVFRPPFVGRGPAGPTYEAAIASNKQEVVIGGNAGPDLTDAQLAGPMHNGAFVGECGAPERMKVTVKVAIKQGRAVGVSVATHPADPDIAGCIDRYVRTSSWPSNGKMDSFTTTY